jgi:eukaryotic-like serine/threonine-protein kinase
MIDGHAIISEYMLQVGDQFDRYQIHSHLARGGMSDIYRAYDLINKREVVLKIPSLEFVGDPAQYERFQRELEVLNHLVHPAILRGLGSGQYNRTPYLVTELMKGQSLREIIDERAPMDMETAVGLIRKIADGMAYCHDQGVIHRDLKPENIMVTEEGQPVIMDFGLALTKGAHRVTYANLSVTMGTPDYMAPEQVEGQRGDQRTDIYALGTILFEMLSGRTPFTGDNNLAVMAQHVQAVAPRLDRIQPGVSPQLAAITARCLQHDPAARYTDMRSFMDALDHPETADLSLLVDADQQIKQLPWWRSYNVKIMGLSLVVIVAIILLAFLAQSFR